MRLRLLSAVAVLGALVAGVVAPAGANPTVAISGTTVSGNTVTVSGTASFPAITAAQSVGGTKTRGASAPAGDSAGLDLTDVKITPIANGLRFTWEVSQMPAAVPPEGTRYNWAFLIGTNMYQLQAKRTNMVSVTTAEDPVGHVQHLQSGKDFFQLRGACVSNYMGTTSNGCYHLAFLNGSFDIAGRKITIDLPYETKDSIGRLVAPDFKPGAVIRDNGGTNTAGMSIAASFQAAVSNTNTSIYINSYNPYYTAPSLGIALDTAGMDPASVTYTPVSAAGGVFSGTLSGYTANGKNTVYVAACNGATCTYASKKA